MLIGAVLIGAVLIGAVLVGAVLIGVLVATSVVEQPVITPATSAAADHRAAPVRHEIGPPVRAGPDRRRRQKYIEDIDNRPTRLVLDVEPTEPESVIDMRAGRRSRLMAMLIAGTVLVGCGAQIPSGQPAVDALVRFYDQRSGVWPTTGWWNSANALNALTNYMIVSGDHRYIWVVDNTFTRKRNAARGNFINDFTDDTGWWALTWISAYDLTGDIRFLQTAQRDVDFMWSNHDDVCGGGLWWTTGRKYKNAISNELFVQAAAELAQRLGDAGSVYLQRAVEVWNWFEASGMVNDELLVNDGLYTSTCRNNGDTTWTYNQGVVLGGLVALARGTGDDRYLARARELADASTTAEILHVDGVLTEPCEQSGCDVNGPSFKGIYVRNLGELNRALSDHPYSDYLAEQASTAYDHNRNADNEYGLHWAGPVQSISAATQQSAVDLLVAAQPVDEPAETSPSPSG